MLPLAFRVCAAAAPCEETYYVKQALQSDRLQVPQSDSTAVRQSSSYIMLAQTQIHVSQIGASDTYPALVCWLSVFLRLANLTRYK